MDWSDLSMKDRANYIKLALDNDISDLGIIRDTYNKYAEGGSLDSSNWTMQDETKYRQWLSTLPDNLRNTDEQDYDMRGAYKAGMQPMWNEEDNSYHLGSRDPKTGRILKSPIHPTYLKALMEDAKLGYYPKTINGKTYTNTWEGNRYEEGGPIKTNHPTLKRKSWETDEDYNYRVQNYSPEKEAEKQRHREEYERNRQLYLETKEGKEKQAAIQRRDSSFFEGAKIPKQNPTSLNKDANLIQDSLQSEIDKAKSLSGGIKEALENQEQERLDKWHDYKKGINATVTALELGLSGASLLGAYSNYRNWVNSANIAKKTIANLLQKAQLPMQVGGTLIDAYQTYDAIQNNNPFETYYNAASMGLGTAGSVGASDIFLNSRLHSPKADRVLDALGVLQNTGDFIKFGYDSLTGDD